MTDSQEVTVAEVFRFSRGDETRIYNLHVAAGGTALWRITVRAGHPDSAIKEDDFTSADAAAQYFRDVERALIAGGWR